MGIGHASHICGKAIFTFCVRSATSILLAHMKGTKDTRRSQFATRSMNLSGEVDPPFGSFSLQSKMKTKASRTSLKLKPGRVRPTD